MAFAPVDLIEVRAWDRTVGAVTLDPASGFYAFEYDDDWARGSQQLAPLHMPNGPGAFVFPGLAPLTFLRLPALLADALPDRFGNALVNAWMATNGVAVEQITPLDRLAYLADRGMGALTFHPPAAAPDDSSVAVQLADLVTAARDAVSGKLTSDQAAHEALRQLIQVGTSAGGARAKAVIAYNPETGQVRSGQAGAPDGFEHWLVKLDGVDTDTTREADPFTDGAGFGRLEYAYHLMARAAGVVMADCRLLPEGPRTHFLTRRFDRGPDGTRHHVLSLCAMAHLDFNLARVHGYEQYLQTAAALDLDAAARQQAFRRVVFNVAAVNRDDHTKNLAFLAREGGDWELAPAFDLTHAHNPDGAWTQAHQMSVNGKFEGITVDDLHVLADRFGVPGFKRVVGDVIAAVARWTDFAEEGGVSGAHIERVASDLEAHRIG
jgi:serine/threonine-protein kinase HipA